VLPRHARAPPFADAASARDALELSLGIVSAETWPARYKVHKYWGRKPANVVARYLAFFSEPGAVVLDPFAGSGVTLVEAARLGREARGFDLNPFAVRLTRAMLAPPAPSAFEQAARLVLGQAHQAFAALYVTRCDRCAHDATLRSVGYLEQEPVQVRYRCAQCGAVAARAPDGRDVSLAHRKVEADGSAPDGDILFGWEMQKLRRRGVKRWSELFTSRNYACAAFLRACILTVSDERARDWLLLTLTASLAQFTRMIADSSGAAGGPSWKINCYWLPRSSQELNPLWYFENRVKKSLEAIRDLGTSGARALSASAQVCDSRKLPLSAQSVDYVFTDPPYGGEGIQYGELSMLWCLWLGEQQVLPAEIAFNPYRSLDQAHYEQGLGEVLAECFRVLKPQAFMTVAFANKDPVVWDALMRAARRAGFALLAAAPMKRSLPSVTETNMHTAPKADLLLSFQRPHVRARMSEPRPVPAESAAQTEPYCVRNAVARIAGLLTSEGLSVTAHGVFDRVTVDWFTWFYGAGARPLSLRPTLAHVERLLAEQAQALAAAPI
jgi:DNA modification methylase